MHQSIVIEGVNQPIPKCTSCCKFYHCPLCPSLMPMSEKKVQAHWKVHIKNAICFQDKRLCKCHLACRTEAHYHCPTCSKTVLRRNEMEAHLQKCLPALALLTSTPALNQSSSSPAPGSALALLTSTPALNQSSSSPAPGSALALLTSTPALTQSSSSPAPGSALALLTSTPALNQSSSSPAPGSALASALALLTSTPALNQSSSSPAPGSALALLTSTPALNQSSSSPAPGSALALLTSTPALNQSSPAPGSALALLTSTPALNQSSSSPAPGSALALLTSTPALNQSSSSPAPGSALALLTSTPALNQSSSSPAPGSALALLTSTPALTPSSSPAPGSASDPCKYTPASAMCKPTPSQSSCTASKNQKSTMCPHCSVVMLKKNLNMHILRKHTDSTKDITMQSHLSSVCIDASNGVSAVQRSGHGFSIPVHVQKKTWGKHHQVRCELQECCQYQQLAYRSGQSFSLCEHLRSLDYCSDTVFEEPLDPSVLDEMLKLKFFGEAKKAVCLKRQKIAQTAHVPFSVLVTLVDSQKQITLSVHEPVIHHFSRLGRVMVTYNSTARTWHCPCAKPRMSCPHKNIAKWHLFQTNKQLFGSDKPAEAIDSSVQQFSENLNHTPLFDLHRTVKYIYSKKKIPSTPLKEVAQPKTSPEFPSSLLPVESSCMVCDGNTALETAVLTTRHAKIVTMTGVINAVSTYTRRCPGCHMVYRYQEWCDGLHNFNDHILLSLELCLYLRHSLQSHVSVSRVIDTLETLRGVKYPNRDTVLHAYCHFEALADLDYTYFCVNCGYHPPVVIMDLHKKGVFSMAVSDLKEPPSEFKGEVNIEEFWQSVDLEMVARGFVSSRTNNPFVVEPSYEKWAPWIGQKTRMGNTVLNTEYEKVFSPKVTSPEAQVLSVSEDHLVDELMKQKVGVVRKLCKACNVDSKGSRMDLILRLRAEMQNRHSYNNIFQKIWGASGGWSVVLCPHGVAYSLKFNLRAESPRDFMDLLLSWQHLPNVTIYDFARGLATHANLRVPSSLPFQPYEGRLADSTLENINKAKQGRLKVSLPWLIEKADTLNSEGHPITGSSEHYVLYDKLHESNTKDPKDVLRKISLVPELQGWLNSQIAEQFFADLRKNNYFINNMAPSTHIFIMRNIIHHKNASANQKILEGQLQRGHIPHSIENVALSDLGQAILTPCSTDKLISPGLGLGPESLKHSPHAAEDNEECGPQCEEVTNCKNITACRASWSLTYHSAQKELLNYILDLEKPANELIIRTAKACLTRADFWTLGLNRDIESTIGNCCFQLIDQIAASKGKDIHIVDLYIVPTWLPPNNCNPMLSLPDDVHLKDAVIIPIWTPGHYQLCVLKPAQSVILHLDSKCYETPHGFGDQRYKSLLRDIANRIIPGKWTEKTGLDLQSALYVVLDAPFDYTILDMAELRKWWCIMLMENFGLDRHGKLFAHYAAESKAFLRGDQQPVFRLPKRTFDQISQEKPFHVQEDEKNGFTTETISEKEVAARKARIMATLKIASQWCLGNSGNLLGSVQLPRILCMEDEEATEALEQYCSADFMEDDVVEPLIFIFTVVQDMHTFLENVVDHMHLEPIFSRIQN